MKINMPDLSRWSRLHQAEIASRHERIASGKRIATASDSPSTWAITTTMRQDMGLSRTARDSLSLSLAVVDAAFAASPIILDGLERIRQFFLFGLKASPGEMKNYDREILQIRESIKTAIKSASFGNANLLYKTTGSPDALVATTFVSRDSDGGLELGTLSMAASDFALIDTTSSAGILSRTYVDKYGFNTGGRRLFGQYAPGYDLSFYRGFNGPVFNAGGLLGNQDIIEQMTTAAQNVFTKLGTVRSSLERHLELAEKFCVIQETALGRLVDADIPEEIARLRAAKVQLQMSTQALYIANASMAHTLDLFR